MQIRDILECLNDPPSARKLLRPQLDMIKRGSNESLSRVMSMDKKLEDWLLYACELYSASVQQENITSDVALGSDLCFAAEAVRHDYQKSTTEEAAKATELLKRQVSSRYDAFQKASDEFPKG